MSDRRKRPSDLPAVGRTPTPREPLPREPQLPRTVTPGSSGPTAHPIGTPPGLSTSAGAMAVTLWLRDRGIFPPVGRRWRVQIALEINDRPASFTFAPTKFQLTIDHDAWGYQFTHGDRTSTIHVTSMASARDRDEHRLLAMTPPLKRIGTLVRELEARYRVFFPRHHAAIRSELSGSEPIIRAWVSSF